MRDFSEKIKIIEEKIKTMTPEQKTEAIKILTLARDKALEVEKIYEEMARLQIAFIKDLEDIRENSFKI